MDFLLALFFTLLVSANDWFFASRENGKFSYSTDKSDEDGYQVSAQYESLKKSINLEKLDITVNTDTYSLDASYCVGYAEGYLMATDIWNSYQSRIESFKTLSSDEGMYDAVKDFTSANMKAINESIANNPDDVYWQHIGMIFEQFSGLVDGYNHRMSKDAQLTADDLWLLQALGEKHDLIALLTDAKYGSISIPNHWMTASGAVSLVFLRDSGIHDLFVGHSAYDSFSALRRVTKRISYRLPHTNKQVYIAYSTAPGCLASTDEVYMTENKLAIAAVKMVSFDDAMYTTDVINGSKVLGWMRSLYASLVSASATQWTQEYIKESSLTDTKTTVIVDYNKYDPKGKSLSSQAPDGTVTVVETYPAIDETSGEAKYKSVDASDTLRDKKYVLIQHTPYTEETYNALRYDQAVGNDATNKFYLSRTESSRVKEAASSFTDNVTNMIQFEDYLRYNAYNTEDSAILPSSTTRDPCIQFGAHCELRSETAELTPMSYGLVGSVVLSKHSLRFKNYAVAAGAAPIYKEDDMSVSDMQKHASFASHGLPSTMMGLDFDQMAMKGERQKTIRIIMLVLLIISSTISLIGATAAIVYCIIRWRRNRKVVE